MAENVIGILHPGAMGSSVGAAAGASGNKVFWVSEDRSDQTRQRAEKAGLQDAGTLESLIKSCGYIVSVCPPAAAFDVAGAISELGFTGYYLDANAISPARTRKIGKLMEVGGARYVDGGIVGGPAWKEGTTRLYLSGENAGEILECFKGSPLEPIVLDNKIGTASALKMAYAAYTKGSTALIGAILALAHQEGVSKALLQEWTISQPTLAERAIDRVRSTTSKSWRFAGEMDESTETFVSANLPGGFHQAAAEVYRRQARFKDQTELPSIAEVMTAMLEKP